MSQWHPREWVKASVHGGPQSGVLHGLLPSQSSVQDSPAAECGSKGPEQLRPQLPPKRGSLLHQERQPATWEKIVGLVLHPFPFPFLSSSCHYRAEKRTRKKFLSSFYLGNPPLTHTKECKILMSPLSSDRSLHIINSQWILLKKFIDQVLFYCLRRC